MIIMYQVPVNNPAHITFVYRAHNTKLVFVTSTWNHALFNRAHLTTHIT